MADERKMKAQVVMTKAAHRLIVHENNVLTARERAANEQLKVTCGQLQAAHNRHTKDYYRIQELERTCDALTAQVEALLKAGR